MIMTTIQSAGAIHGRPAASHKITPGYYPTSLHEYQPQPQAQLNLIGACVKSALKSRVGAGLYPRDRIEQLFQEGGLV